jgi:hypothetical protein
MIFRLQALLIVFLWFQSASAQYYTIKGKVTDQNSKEGLAFVNISFDNSHRGITSNIDGAFTIVVPSAVNQLIFSYVGYETKIVQVQPKDIGKELQIRLTRKEIELAEVTVKPGENPAHRIIKKVMENRDKNNPEKMRSFSYTSYNKMYIIAQQDTSLHRKHPTIQLDTLARDTSNRLSKLLRRQHLLLMEFVSQRYFKHPDKNYEKIISSKVSGFTDPSFTLLATQMQSFAFYDNMITLLGKEYLNPISPGSTRKYFFLLKDTFITETFDTLFVISFRPKRGSNFNGLKGVLYINTNGYAIQNVIAEPSQIDKRFAIRIQQRYELIAHKQWFPTQLNTDLLFKSSTIKTKQGEYYPVGIGKSYLSDINIDPDLSKVKFSNVEVQVAENAHKQTDSTWQMYRKAPLTAKDSATYHIIDSIGRAKKFDQKLKFFEAFTLGYIPYKIFNIDYTKIFSFNSYEGVRLGFGMATNYKVASFFSLGGSFAYGFTDKQWKYSTSLQLFPDWSSETKLSIKHTHDVKETAKYSFFEDNVMTSTEWYRDFLIDQMDMVDEKEVALSYRMLRYLKMNLYLNQSHKYLNNYGFVVYKEGIPSQASNFNFTEAGIEVKFGFKEKFLLTPSKRKLSLGTPYPMVWFNYKRGLKLWNGDFTYNKYELKVSTKFVTRKTGKSQITLVTGKVDGNIPLSNLYNGHGSFMPFTIEAENSFATMRMNEFYSSEFVSLFLKQDFGSLLFNTPGFKPELCLVTDIGFGKMLHKEFHKITTFNTLEKGYYESGILINRILSSQLTSLGFGVYYRYGPYMYARIANNFAYKVTLALNL